MHHDHHYQTFLWSLDFFTVAIITDYHQHDDVDIYLSHLPLVSGLLSGEVVPLPPLKILLVLQVLRNRLLLTSVQIYQPINVVQYNFIGCALHSAL